VNFQTALIFPIVLPKWTGAYDLNTEPDLEFGDMVQMKNHLLKPQLDFLERFQQRRQGPQ
jgi:hypothetical protein